MDAFYMSSIGLYYRTNLTSPTSSAGQGDERRKAAEASAACLKKRYEFLGLFVVLLGAFLFGTLIGLYELVFVLYAEGILVGALQALALFVTVEIEHLPSLDTKKKQHKDIEKDEFDELLKELLIEKADTLRRLAKK